jgi:DNA-binding PadR family transcriptional regulator
MSGKPVRDDVTGNDPIGDLGGYTDASVHIMVALSDGPRHGYAIMAEVERETGRPMRPGTLYAALSRLERRGLVEAMPAEDRRHPYRLTTMGTQALAAVLDRMEALAARGRERLERGDA